jgi:hypothetical protein
LSVSLWKRNSEVERRYCKGPTVENLLTQFHPSSTVRTYFYKVHINHIPLLSSWSYCKYSKHFLTKTCRHKLPPISHYFLTQLKTQVKVFSFSKLTNLSTCIVHNLSFSRWRIKMLSAFLQTLGRKNMCN